MSQLLFPPLCLPQVKDQIRADIISACVANNVGKLGAALTYAMGLSRSDLEFRRHWIDFYDARGHNPLMTSIFHGSNDVVLYLLTKASSEPARLDCGHRFGTTATHVAAYRQNFVALQMLHQHANTYEWSNSLRHQDCWGKLPLHHAHYHGFQEGIEFLTKDSPEGVRDSSNRLPEQQERPESKAEGRSCKPVVDE